MKLFFSLAFCCLVFNGFSQSFRLSGTALWVSSDEVAGTYNNGDSYSGTVNGGLQWGASGEYLINNKYGLELGFLTQKTTIPLSYKNTYETRSSEYELSVSSLLLKGNRYFGKKENKIQGVLGLAVGLNMFNYHDISSKAYPAFQANTGLIYWPAKVIGIKLHGQYQYSSQGTGEAISVKYFTEKSGGLKSSTPLSQFGIGLSAIFVMDEIFKE